MQSASVSHAFVIPADHPCLPGHFPGRPLVPGVVVLDHVLDAVLAAASGTAPSALRLPQVKFLQPLRPGEPARVELEPLPAAGDGAPRWRFRVCRDAVLLASGELVAGGGR